MHKSGAIGQKDHDDCTKRQGRGRLWVQRTQDRAELGADCQGIELQ